MWVSQGNIFSSLYFPFLFFFQYNVIEHAHVQLTFTNNNLQQNDNYNLKLKKSIFLGFFTQLHKLHSLRRSFLHFILFPKSIYDLFHTSLTLISFTGKYEPTIDLLLTDRSGRHLFPSKPNWHFPLSGSHKTFHFSYMNFLSLEISVHKSLFNFQGKTNSGWHE